MGRAHIAAAAAGLFMLAGAACATGQQSCAPVGSGDLFYTRYGGTPNVERVHYTYSKGNFQLGKPVSVATVSSADGIAFAPDGDVLVGSQSAVLYKVHVSDGKVAKASTGGPAAYHVVVDPDGKRAWVAGIPGALAEVPLKPFGPGRMHPLKGDDTSVTSLAFSGGSAYYTSSGAGGVGRFGRIDLKAFTTHRALTDQPGLHGMAYDTFSASLVTFGADRIVQIDPKSLKVISQLQVGGGVALDQGTVNDAGYIYVASNNGQLVFLDYTKSKRVADRRNVLSVTPLQDYLDDVAPLSGPGAEPCKG